ncbi:MAG: AMP-binding protein, partial [Pseudomonadota bacterium]
MTEAWAGDFDDRIGTEALEARAAKGAAALAALGVGDGDPLAVVMRNDLAQIEILRAAAFRGAVIVPINWHAAAEEAAAILDDSGARVVALHRDLIEPLRPALAGRKLVAVAPRPQLRAAYGIDDAAAGAAADAPEWSDLVDAAEPAAERAPMRPQMRYTSGSTGRPKGVRRVASGPRRDYVEALRAIGTEMMRFRPGARFFTAAPIYHSAPSTLTNAALVAPGVSTLLAPRFEPESFLAAVEREKITHVYLVPTMMSRLLKLPDETKATFDPSSVEFCVSTGSPWPHDLKAAMIDWWGPVFWESYGATEIGFMTLISSEEAMARPGSAGRMQLGATAMILDAEGNELPPGEPGEIHVRMPIFGDFDYTNDPGSRRAGEKRGHFSVGDVGWMDEEGYLFITDRKKDMI